MVARSTPSMRTWPLSAVWKAQISEMMVDFAGAGGADERGDGAGFGFEADAVEDGLLGFVAEGDVVEGYVAADGRHEDGALGLGVLFVLGHDLGGAVESGYGFGELCADGDELGDRGDHEREKHDIGDVAAGGETAADDLMGSEVHDESAHDAQDGRRGKRHEGLRG